ncbi:MAG TPA: hypothetical protein VFD30_20465 [Terriglobia bacterium]|nr:hypothetical protein [Terriglobia bacterium]
MTRGRKRSCWFAGLPKLPEIHKGVPAEADNTLVDRCFCGRPKSATEFVCRGCYGMAPVEIQNQLIRGGRWADARQELQAYLHKTAPWHLVQGEAWKRYDAIQHADGRCM